MEWIVIWLDLDYLVRVYKRNMMVTNSLLGGSPWGVWNSTLNSPISCCRYLGRNVGFFCLASVSICTTYATILCYNILSNSSLLTTSTTYAFTPWKVIDLPSKTVKCDVWSPKQSNPILWATLCPTPLEDPPKERPADQLHFSGPRCLLEQTYNTLSLVFSHSLWLLHWMNQ